MLRCISLSSPPPIDRLIRNAGKPIRAANTTLTSLSETMLLTTTTKRLPIAISRSLRSINGSAATATSLAPRRLHSASFAQQRSASALRGSRTTRCRPTLFSPAMASTATTPSGKYSTLATPDYCYVDFCLVPVSSSSTPPNLAQPPPLPFFIIIHEHAHTYSSTACPISMLTVVLLLSFFLSSP